MFMLMYCIVSPTHPDDHSRVKLKEIPNRPGSDYINGNYIDVRSALL